jgi:hypothetical protein
MVLIIMGASVISGISGCAGDGAKYLKYSNSNPQVNLSVEYPEGWKYIAYKNQQSGFPIVMFAPPAETTEKTRAFSVFMSVEVAGMKDAAGKELSAKAVTDGIIERELKMPQAQLVSRTKTSIGFTKAEDIVISLKMLEKLDSRKANLLPSRAHIIAMKKGDKVYAVKLVARQEEYERYGKAFDRMVKTLKKIN